MSKAHTFIHHVGITAPASVLDEVVAFYDQILDLKTGFRPDFGVGGFWIYSGDQPIIHLLEDANRSSEKSGHFDHVALRCQGLENILARLRDADIPFSRFDNPELGQVQLFLTDPSGTAVELNFSV